MGRGRAMAVNLLLGAPMISLAVLVHPFGLMAVTRGMALPVARFRMPGHR